MGLKIANRVAFVISLRAAAVNCRDGFYQQDPADLIILQKRLINCLSCYCFYVLSLCLWPFHYLFHLFPVSCHHPHLSALLPSLKWASFAPFSLFPLLLCRYISILRAFQVVFLSFFVFFSLEFIPFHGVVVHRHKVYCRGATVAFGLSKKGR